MDKNQIKVKEAQHLYREHLQGSVEEIREVNAVLADEPLLDVTANQDASAKQPANKVVNYSRSSTEFKNQPMRWDKTMEESKKQTIMPKIKGKNF
jgi:hypothetical protein